MATGSSAAQEVLTRIKEDIISGEIIEGETITERWLEKRYGVSRTPIREALKQLDLEGWVETTPYRETRVTHLGIEELRDSLPVRVALESIATQFCILRMTESTRKDFEQLLSDIRALKEDCSNQRADLVDHYNELDDRFHTLIYRHSGSRMLMDFAIRLRSMFERIYRVKSLLFCKKPSGDWYVTSA